MSKKISNFKNFKIEEIKMINKKNPLEFQETLVKLEEVKHEKMEESSVTEPECDSISTHSESSESIKKDIPKPQRKIIKLVKTECEICGLNLLKKNIHKHMKRVHQDEAILPFICTACDRKFSSQKNLNIHMSSLHPKEYAESKKSEQFVCDFDGKIFNSRNEIQLHMPVHMKSKTMKVKCSICEIEIQQRYMNRHISAVHTDIKKFQCDICSFETKTMQNLKAHKKGHNKELECEVCKKTFAIKSRLNLHMKTVHSKPESYVCETCGKEFDKNKNLIYHQKVHKEKTKKFKCDRCPYAFYAIRDLKRHQETHVKEDARVAAMKNPLKCETCSKYLSNKKALTRHMKIVHQDEQLPCSLCGKLFKSKNTLDNHIQKRKCEIIKNLN